MEGLQGIWATVARLVLSRAVRQPMRAAARAASQPAWPAPTTRTSKLAAGVRGRRKRMASSSHALVCLGPISGLAAIYTRILAPPSSWRAVAPLEPSIAVQDSDPNAQLIDAFVVPTDTGSAVLVDTDFRRLDADVGPFQIALYSRLPLSMGELAVIRARVEADLFAHAVRTATEGRRWVLALVTGLLEMGVLGVLLAFFFLNREPVHAVVVWAAPLGFLPGLRCVWRAVAGRQAGARARSTLELGELLPTAAVGRDGESLARLRDLWRIAGEPDEPRDLMRLERVAREQVRWPAAARFYRDLADAPQVSAPPGRLARLRGLTRTRRGRPYPLTHLTARSR